MPCSSTAAVDQAADRRVAGGGVGNVPCTEAVGQRDQAGYRLLAQPVSGPPAMGELTVMGQQRREDLLTYSRRRFAAERVEELAKEAAST